MALWSDSESVALGPVDQGYQSFAAGVPGSLVTANSSRVSSISFNGTALAQQLLSAGKASQVFEVRALSQGNKGLRYTAAWQGTWASGTPLANAGTTLSFFKVGNAAACTPDATAPSPNPLTSTPVTAAYSDSTAATTEFWCLVARGTMTDAGTHSNTAGATASDAGGTTVVATPGGRGATWTATVTTALQAANQGARTVTFSYETFRPGA